MIRDYQNQDLDRIMDLWLETNIFVHSFIDKEYWLNNFDIVKTMMPNATVYVYEDNGIIQGFIGLLNDYIAGLFISQPFQSKGIGKALLDYTKTQNETLSLGVYKKNNRAVRFYLREGFTVSNNQIEENTGEIELCMNWNRSQKR